MPIIMRAVAFLLLVLVVSSPVALRAQSVPPFEEGVLLPGDRLELVVYGNQELSGIHTIAADSTLLHPRLSEIRVSGMPMSAARARMREFLATHYQNPMFLFQPQYRVYVGGSVGVQGQYHLVPMTIGQAITQAGGSTAPNRRRRVRLIRNGEHTLADLNGRAETELLQTPIRSGDQIIIEDRPSLMRNYVTPALQAAQTITALIATYVYLNEIFSRE